MPVLMNNSGLWAGADTPNPLLDQDGASRVQPSGLVRIVREDGSGALASSGPQRHTRARHTLRTIRYRIGIAAADGRDVEMLRQADAVSRGGAGGMRWRHPIDDAAGPVETAPIYRIVSDELAVSRRRGGAVGSVEIVVERV